MTKETTTSAIAAAGAEPGPAEADPRAAEAGPGAAEAEPGAAVAEPGPGTADGEHLATALRSRRSASEKRPAAADRVTVRMPADGAYLSVLRTATAGLAARLDFTLDDIEDLRIAVDEACAMLLSQAIPGSSLECCFTLNADEMTISVSVPSLNPRTPSGDTFAWTVLSALAGTVEAQVGPGDRLAIVMRKSHPSSRSA